MLPTGITAWADKYAISQPIMWEIIETVTNDGNNLNEIEDETHLFNYTIEWVCAMIEMVAEDGSEANYQAYILYYLPVVFALAPHLNIEQRSRMMAVCHGDRLLVRGLDCMFNRDDESPTVPASLR